MINPVHEITVGEHGHRHGTDGRLTVSLLDESGRMFKRRAVKGFGTGSGEEVCWLVVELENVKIYQQGDHVIVTRQDIYP